ncbi:TRAP transporter small permease [Mangrovibrevibacter kandeliae]|uniref:TRAP transporter small permease n=1 Tax=Mangrovibrevibacter kandeliae TaxID=2968473 RepID=UPI002117D1C8|nr:MULTISPECIES: TRAP transporter small permease subunit [unclassified Aurantimonas]MCQ8784280.1 TRAP transporter small permease [Aurantimonas sp. CSK15Z-1]MCW4117036.1 TRAP transporter small permease [Aurantimonas sp. MSK8Z-1]
MGRSLAVLYRLTAWLAALCLVTILGLVALQIGARLIDWGLRSAGLPATGFIVPSLAEISGYLLAAATFLGLADTLAANVHIRVNLLAERLPMRARMLLEGVVALLGAAIAGFAAWALAAYGWKSFSHGDVSYGMVQVPLALPQAAMAVGLLVFAIALLEESVLGFTGRARHLAAGSTI